MLILLGIGMSPGELTQFFDVFDSKGFRIWSCSV